MAKINKKYSGCLIDDLTKLECELGCQIHQGFRSQIKESNGFTIEPAEYILWRDRRFNPTREIENLQNAIDLAIEVGKCGDPNYEWQLADMKKSLEELKTKKRTDPETVNEFFDCDRILKLSLEWRKMIPKSWRPLLIIGDNLNGGFLCLDKKGYIYSIYLDGGFSGEKLRNFLVEKSFDLFLQHCDDLHKELSQEQNAGTEEANPKG